MSGRWIRTALRAAAFLAIYVGAAQLLHGVYVFRIAVLWLPTGVAVAGLWLLGIPYWPVIAIGTIVHRTLIGYPFPTYVVGALGNTLEAVIAVALLRRFGFRPPMARMRDVLALLATAALAPIVSAVLGRARYFVSPDQFSYFEGLAGWWRMNALGILVVLPLVLSWTSVPLRRPDRRTLVEIAIVVFSVVGLVWLLAFRIPPNAQSGMVLSYLALPVALYAALRFGVRGAATAGAGIVVLLTLGTVYGIGPFIAASPVSAPPQVRELALQALIAIVMVTPLLLGAAVSEREAALRESAIERERHEDLMSSINRNVNEGLFRISADRRFVYANAALARMLGYGSPEELVVLAPEALVADAGRAGELAGRLVEQGSIANEELALRHRDGSARLTLASCTAVRGADGVVQCFDGAVSDITARKRLEEQLRQAQKLEALGKLAGGIAHDFNNALTAIGGYAELVRDRLPQDAAPRRDAMEILRATERASNLTRQLLAYSRRQKLEPHVLALGEVVERLGEALRRIIGENIELVTRHADGATLVRVDRGQLEQVVVNLVVNAREAMPGGGTLTLTTAPFEVSESLARAHAGAVAGPHVCLVVEDTGVGMDEDVRSRAFDPFFTTKPLARGAGLGLSTVYGIVRQSGGFVWLESRPGEGTRVHVCLPRVAGRPAEPAAPPAPAPAAGRGARVLVVEDEAMVRDLMSLTLSGAGYEVHQAENGEHGLEVARAAPGPIDLVVTDVVMPRMGGREMTLQLARERPGLRVLFISGYATDDPGPSDPLGAGVDYLQKPFSSSELLERVRASLASGGALPRR